MLSFYSRRINSMFKHLLKNKNYIFSFTGVRMSPEAESALCSGARKCRADILIATKGKP